MLITTSSILGQNVEVMASNPTNYKDMTEYAAYENVIADAGALPEILAFPWLYMILIRTE